MLVLWSVLLDCLQANAQCHLKLGNLLRVQATMRSLIHHFVFSASAPIVIIDLDMSRKKTIPICIPIPMQDDCAAMNVSRFKTYLLLVEQRYQQ